jgi:peptidoglycan/LPS O-acetylase OafA/YrhL
LRLRQSTAIQIPVNENQGERKMHPGIIGLRAIAVLSVVVFHFAPNTLPGGFVGVDVFFVISGYLISRSIYAQVAEGRFSFLGFYERRARRIVPAFVVVSGATLIAGYFILLPPALADAAKSLLASVAFSANIFFYASSDYFSPAAEQMPLLHLWSLGVEEQFYLVFPVLVVAVARWAPRALPAVLMVLLVVSVASSEVALQSSPQASFYLPWNRAFELLIGAILALPSVRLAGNRTGLAATFLGLAILAASFWLITPQSRFPGLVALVPCLGTALVIWGAHLPVHTLARTMRAKPMAYFSDISYSLYLVHWPIVVYGHMLFPDIIPWTFALVGMALSIVLAWISFTWVEQPVRNNRRIFTQKRVLSGAGASFACIAILAGVVVSNAGFSGRLTDRANVILESLHYNPKPAFETEVCFLEPHQEVTDYNVDRCVPGKRPLALLWGDSHLAQYLYGLRPLFNDAGYAVGQFGSSGCAPALQVDSAVRPKCRAFNDFAIREILRLDPDLVILGAVWVSVPEQLEGLGRSIETLQSAGIKVVVFGNSPLFKDSVPTILAKRLLAGNTDTRSGADLEIEFMERNNSAIREAVAKFPGADFVSIYDIECKEEGCPLEHEGNPIHFDITHMTDTGSEYYASIVFPKLKPRLKAAEFHQSNDD